TDRSPRPYHRDPSQFSDGNRTTPRALAARYVGDRHRSQLVGAAPPDQYSLTRKARCGEPQHGPRDCPAPPTPVPGPPAQPASSGPSYARTGTAGPPGVAPALTSALSSSAPGSRQGRAAATGDAAPDGASAARRSGCAAHRHAG